MSSARISVDETVTQPSLFDPHESLLRAGGDPQLQRELIDLFLEEAPKQREQIREALARREDQELRRAAHTLKSSALAFGARSTGDAASQLESLSCQSDVDAAVEACAALESELDRLLSALSEYRNTRP